jgi:hypothetical protein
VRHLEHPARDVRLHVRLDHRVGGAHPIGSEVEHELAEIELVHPLGQQAIGDCRIDVLLAQDLGDDIVDVVAARQLAPRVGGQRGLGALVAAALAAAPHLQEPP